MKNLPLLHFKDFDNYKSGDTTTFVFTAFFEEYVKIIKMYKHFLIKYYILLKSFVLKNKFID